MKKILIPIDGSEYSQRAMEQGKEFAKVFDSSIVLLNAVYIPLPIYTTHDGDRGLNMAQLAENAKKQSEDMLKTAKDYFADMSDKVETVAAEGDIATTVVEYANNNDVDFIIMGSHGMGAVLHRLLVGSVTTKVLHHAAQPVLVVK